MKSAREHEIDNQESLDIPTQSQLIKIVQELTIKMVKMEEKINEMQKWVVNKKRKLNVIKWLNQHVCPDLNFTEWVNSINVSSEHYDYLRQNTIFETIEKILEDNLKKIDTIYPIKYFIQKASSSYIYKQNEAGEFLWFPMEITDIKLILQKIQNSLIHALNKWKNNNNADINDNTSINVQTTILKIMNIPIKSDNNMNRVKQILYNILKTDIQFITEQDVELEF